MSKKVIIRIAIAIIASMIIFPVLVNGLMFVHLGPVAGDQTAWIGLLGSYWGAIIGGVISGALTLVGVIYTINASTEGIQKTLNEQRQIREEDLAILTAKERLLHFYHPVDALHAEFAFQHGAHYFTHLTKEQQKKFLKLMNNNIVYADAKMYRLYVELQWAIKERNPKVINDRYYKIVSLITSEVETLRNQLKLPDISNFLDEDEDENENEDELDEEANE